MRYGDQGSHSVGSPSRGTELISEELPSAIKSKRKPALGDGGWQKRSETMNRRLDPGPLYERAKARNIQSEMDEVFSWFTQKRRPFQ